MRIRVVGLVILVISGLAGLVIGTPIGHKPAGVLWQPPSVTPRPQRMAGLDRPIQVPRVVHLRLSGDVDQSTRDLLNSVLRGAGASQIQTGDTGDQPALTVVMGPLTDATVASELRAVAGSAPNSLPVQGYALASKPGAGSGTVVLAGADVDGLYYAAQTLRQLAGSGTIASVSIVDYPDAAVRGVVEGFYGTPWSQPARLDQMDFYGSVKLNTFMYAPKDDPFHRARWKEPYPADQLADLGTLVNAARRNHVRFLFALSPGVSICFSDPADRQAIETKLKSIYDLGVRDFVLAWDDINYLQWNCDSDQEVYGDPSAEAAGKAQADVINQVQTGFLDHLDGARPLTIVPTEYYDVDDSPYKTVLRERLLRAIGVMWTGTAVLPSKITVEDAAAAEKVWGRKVFLWDNYPVSDFDVNGRVLLGPYANRAPGLATALSGMLLNPMSRAAASKVALIGGADFTWHDNGYEPERTAVLAAEHFAGGDQRTTVALLDFFDVEHIAPTSDNEITLPQAPRLAERLDAFTTAWSSGDKKAALDTLRPYAAELAAAPARIRSGVKDPAFLADCAPWLDAFSLWGQAFTHTLAALTARASGTEDTASNEFANAADLIDKANAVLADPAATAPVKVADGVLDTFLQDAADLR
jgi:hyaluronoglucosaminidase